MKALVTGADGFVGQHLIAELLEHGFSVAASALDLLTGESLGTSALAWQRWWEGAQEGFVPEQPRE